jgi:phosphatidylinositol-bisphosphatase
LFGEIRDSWVRRHMVAREADYTVRKPLSVRVFTWNVAGKKPPSDLERTIQVHLKPLISDCSVFAFGLQEAVKLNAENVGKGNDGPLEGSAILWESALSSALRSVTYDGAFRQLVCRQMMGIVLLVYVREELASACGTPRVCAVGTGLLGLVGNKGAVAASLRIHSSNVCFVCAHMASGSNATEARNLEYAQLLLRLSFPQPLDSAATLDRTLSRLPPGGSGGSSGRGGGGGGRHA